MHTAPAQGGTFHVSTPRWIQVQIELCTAGTPARSLSLNDSPGLQRSPDGVARENLPLRATRSDGTRPIGPEYSLPQPADR